LEPPAAVEPEAVGEAVGVGLLQAPNKRPNAAIGQYRLTTFEAMAKEEKTPESLACIVHFSH
jgi:hypothetical protein